jgi:hypothetical protein
MPSMYPPVSSTPFCSHFSVTRDKELGSYKCELHKWNNIETDVELQSTVLQVGLRSSYAINFNNNFTPKYSGTSVSISEKFILFNTYCFQCSRERQLYRQENFTCLMQHDGILSQACWVKYYMFSMKYKMCCIIVWLYGYQCYGGSYRHLSIYAQGGGNIFLFSLGNPLPEYTEFYMPEDCSLMITTVRI